MQRIKLTFPGATGLELAGALELPDQVPLGYVLFAHCFSCGKDIPAASRISRSLAEKGFAVLRFDFTGLGGSNGDFGNTSFSTNVEDLVAAAAALRERYKAPALLIGHSLGGAAVLAAAHQIPEAEAVITIGAPSSPEHVLHHLAEQKDTIEQEGCASVKLGNRTFHIRRKFLDDISDHNMKDHIRKLKKALLVFHAPLDQTVGVEEARKIFETARHPKSFISLDQADHLLTGPADATYVGHTIAAWAERYISLSSETSKPNRSQPDTVGAGEVLVTEQDKAFLRSIRTDSHNWLADEPLTMGGGNQGPDPYEMLLAALGACTSMTIRLYANHKQWPLNDIRVTLSHTREHSQDCADCEKEGQKIDVIERRIELTGPLDQEQRARLLQIAGRCPVHRTLENKIVVRDHLLPLAPSA
ncbi:bifunctional alpha/beta hydrolase/OsmC family protein [Kiloniella laminariae]|uniref:Bifunctional alpha/beta hydrolase/OsmC family protein n=1 Tax=Kiloniella laminariae TaxID=454162 RepID=A0ABT4LP45_9PROT|nr:bifunctional alpha/beta hydrolase/OsmC family protein [Kiloniella laminariae]MCZ4282866.1 bifunctional alpha/beta hydrolase/OsmC family protein [Kiloniella laminariae]